MKTVIELDEQDLKNILATRFEVDIGNINFHTEITDADRPNETAKYSVCATIIKKEI